MLDKKPTRYPLLEEILTMKGLPLQPMYTIKDVAKIFGVSARAIQNRTTGGQLIPRDLPGHAKFLSPDLEEFLLNSRKSGC
jgi:hypothetical protein